MASFFTQCSCATFFVPVQTACPNISCPSSVAQRDSGMLTTYNIFSQLPGTDCQGLAAVAEEGGDSDGAATRMGRRLGCGGDPYWAGGQEPKVKAAGRPSDRSGICNCHAARRAGHGTHGPGGGAATERGRRRPGFAACASPPPLLGKGAAPQEKRERGGPRAAAPTDAAGWVQSVGVRPADGGGRSGAGDTAVAPRSPRPTAGGVTAALGPVPSSMCGWCRAVQVRAAVSAAAGCIFRRGLI